MSAVSLTPIAVGDIQGVFLVPAYQRGYRWCDEQVKALLDDVHAVREESYYLQPVVVKKLEDGRFELIDGQQRLTTLYLLFRYMNLEGFEKSEPPFSITYATRPQSAEFLRGPDEARSKANIDFFHIWGAFQCIRRWFEQHGHKRELVAGKLYDKLFERVKVIWYEAAPEDDSTALFTRLNVGRIPLTNAELVKALLLSRSRERPATPSLEERRQLEIATQWDAIEQELQDPAFWAFLTNRTPAEYPTRIELLFELLAGRPTTRDKFHTFFHFKDQLDGDRPPEKVWQDVLARHAQLRDWYEDRDLYHLIGFLIATEPERGDVLAELIRESARQTKSELRRGLTAKISQRLDLKEDDLEGLDYEEDYLKCTRALLLFNVESTRLLKDSLERYPFHAHKKERWSREHIHAQNAEQLNKKEQWQRWLREHASALEALRPADRELIEKRDQLVSEIDKMIDDVTGDSFLPLVDRVIEMFGWFDAPDALHRIDNLALLSSKANSELSNAVFEVKRRRMLSMDRRGDYIPICTRRVFLKYYTESADHLHFWGKQDRKAYLDALRESLKPYYGASTDVERRIA